MRTIKRELSLLLAVVMILALGAVPALAAPEVSVAETVLVDNDQVTMTVTGFDPAGYWGPTFEVLLENKTDQDLRFRLDGTAVNGVMSDPYWSEGVPAGKKTYSELGWETESLQQIGVNYIQTVTGQLHVYDSESYDDVFVTDVSWTMDVTETDMPAVEPVTYDHGFAEQGVFSGDVVFTVKDYDPAGSYDGGPSLVFYMENHTDKAVWFTIDDVSLNGVVCDPFWGTTVAPGMAAYARCEWWQDDLDKSHIDGVELIEFTATAEDDETFESLAGAGVAIDVSGAAAAQTGGGQPEQTAQQEPSGQADGETAALLGAVDGNVYTNDFFGVTCTLPDDWRFYSDEEVLAQQGLAAENFEDTDLGDYIDQFIDSDSGFMVMVAEKEGGVQNVNVLVETMPGIGQYLGEQELVTAVMHEMGLGEDGDMSALGLEGAKMEQNTFTFGGQEHAGLCMSYTDTSMGIEIPMYMQMVFLKKDDYLMQLTFTTVFEDHIADVAGMFSLAQ